MFVDPIAVEPICLATVQITYWLLWGGSLALSVTLVALLWTRWGHSRPLHKCAVLSLIAHLILAFLTMTVRIVTSDGGGDAGGGPPIRVRIVEEADRLNKPKNRSRTLLIDLPKAISLTTRNRE
jgi:hypothetical protein